MLAIASMSLAPTALASPTTYTLSGSSGNEVPMSPDSDTRNASVTATLKHGTAAGSLETSGRNSLGLFEVFHGDVTCMKVKDDGRRVTVGAFGTVAQEGHATLPGKYAQVLTVEFGEFEDPFEPTHIVKNTFAILGTEGQGNPSSVPPSCKKASFAHQIIGYYDDMVLSRTKS